MQTEIKKRITTVDALDDQEIQFISNFIYQRSGIVLGEAKKYLIESRLRSVARVMGYSRVSQICEELSNNPPQLATLVLDALTTNETSWFRDSTPFETLTNHIFPRIKRTKENKVLQIWSAACATGQEPYSVAMQVMESGFFKDWHIRIVATDISSEALQQARDGLYTQLEVNRGLPMRLLIRYFAQLGDAWLVQPRLKEMVTFSSHRLQDDAASLGLFDIVLCRNVLIYFDLETKRKILSKIHGVMTKDGLLLLGGSESTLNISDDFSPVLINRSSVYTKTVCMEPWETA